MAAEIRVRATLSVNNGNFKLPELASGAFTFDQTTPGGGLPGEVQVTTTGAALDLSALTGKGWLWMKNLDPTNFVQWGADNTGLELVGRLEPGEPAIFRLDPSGTLFLKADTATCRVQVIAIEN